MIESLKRLWHYVKPLRVRLGWAAVAMICVAIINGSSPYILKLAMDNALKIKDEKALVTLVLLLPLFFLIKMIAQYSQAYLMSYIGQKTVQTIREDLFIHLHDLSVEFYWRKRSGEIMSRVTNDLTQLQSALQFTPLYLIRDTLTVLFIVVFLFVINWRFTLIALLVGPLAGIVLGTLGKKMRKAVSRSQNTVGHIYHRFQESMEGMAIVKAFNYEQGAIEKFRKENDELFSQTMRYLRATALSGPLMEFMGSLVLALLVYFGGTQILAGKMSIGDFGAFAGAFFLGYGPLKNLAQANASVQMGLVSWSRVLHLLDEKPTVVEIPNPKPVGKLEGRITFENVTYKYPTGQVNTLENLSLDIKPGEAVAFVGPSGSGKTTIVNLLLRLFDPTEGRILYDGQDLRELNLRELRIHVGLVSQTTILFDDNVSRNIALGMPEATQEAIVEACKMADAHRFINEATYGYDTMLGERGVKLSGGQRQRLAIARALLKKPAVLILDEATSNLDTQSEKAVQDALEKLLGGRTVIMVAHRLSTIQNADRICVLNHGRIVEQGRHAELLAMNGIYTRMHEIQTAGTGS